MKAHDVALRIGRYGGDAALANGDLEGEAGLATCVLISLFSDARDGSDRGWCLETPGDRFGSRLWTLRGRSTSRETRLLAVQYAREALQWMIEDEIAERIDIVGTYLSRELLNLDIQILRSNERRWDAVWAATGGMEPIVIDDSFRLTLGFGIPATAGGSGVGGIGGI